MYDSPVLMNLAMFLPELVKLVGPSTFAWGEFDQIFDAEVERRKQIGNGEPVIIEATLFDIIIAARKENNSALGMLYFLNNVFKDLSGNLNEVEKKSIHKNIRDLLSAMDKDYLNYAAEIAVLNSLMRTKEYFLEAVEEPMTNGKSIDFKLVRKDNGKIYLTEIVSIHINEDKVQDDPSLIESFFTYRLQQKIDKKMKGLNGPPPFHLIPVLWGGYRFIKIYGDFFEKNKLRFGNVTEPVSYLMKTDGAGFFVHDFKIVSNLFRKH